MRQFQVGVFVLGVVAFLASACFTGKAMGDTFWKVGTAIMVSNLVLMMLWSAAKRS